jgi:hypothetical protein
MGCVEGSGVPVLYIGRTVRELPLLACFTSQTFDGHGVNLYCFIMITVTVTGMRMIIMVIKKETKLMQKKLSQMLMQ